MLSVRKVENTEEGRAFLYTLLINLSNPLQAIQMKSQNLIELMLQADRYFYLNNFMKIVVMEIAGLDKKDFLIPSLHSNPLVFLQITHS